MIAATTNAAQRLIADFYRAYNAHDAESAAALYRDDGAHLDMARGSSRSGRAAVRDGLRGFFGAFEDLSWTVTSVHVGKEQHAAIYVMRGCADREGARRPIALTGVHTFKVDGASLAETRDYWNLDEFRRQLAPD
jgi:uncharacterized protein (TIGR02246 family)